ncbi:hypothetical protein LTR49_001515 [Elasticomyces elasticus]|nr:hypothetical protein LTR49_001515 [Elasticomyces elasticus]
MQRHAKQQQTMASKPEISSTAIAEVDRLLKELEKNLEHARLSLKEQQALLGQLKVYGRDTKTAGPIFTRKGIHILSQYGLDHPSSDTSHEALRCLANALLLNEPSRQTFVDLGYAPKAAAILKVDNRDDEFLNSRILFLLTYKTDIDIKELVEQHELAATINKRVERHASIIGTGAQTPTGFAAMVETFKLLFNVTHFRSDLVPMFTPSIDPLIRLLLHLELPDPPLQPPITVTLNALLNLDFENTQNQPDSTANPLFPSDRPEKVIERLIFILDRALKNHPEKDLDDAAAPLCTFIRRVHEIAPPAVRSWMREALLPQEKDRDQPLGKGDSLPSRLLRASCSPKLPTLGDNIFCLLFELSDEDANKLVSNIGYGFASGFLNNHNIKIPASVGGEQRAEAGLDSNPVTGQRLSAEDHGSSVGPEMTDDEKEREAERLFVLFERLRATGVVDVKIPVQQAVDEGRFEELSD